ncbi:MAG: YhfC family intramembrane metalloprotease [Anaerolineae bacterium]|nr:YhfC family intramembrane metalloprotease [Anaerolineae bacterium]
MISLLLIVNGVLMFLAPVVAVWLIRRYRRMPWSLWGIGAATFILSQVGHIPFNGVVLRWWQPDPTRQFIPTILFLGLSAGLFEEIARYLTFRFWAKSARSWGAGLMVGAGHGGIEAVIIGLLFFNQLVNLLLYRAGWLDAALATVPPEQVELLDAAATTLFSLPWYEAMLGGVERVFAVCLHLCASLLVLRAVMSGKLGWLAAAIFWHAFANSGAVYLAQTVSPLAAEGFLLIVALLSLAFIFATRTPEPEPPPLEPLPPPAPVTLKPVPLDGDKLDESRFG